MFARFLVVLGWSERGSENRLKNRRVGEGWEDSWK